MTALDQATTGVDLLAVSPFIALGAAAVAIVVAVTVSRRHLVFVAIAAAGVAAALALVVVLSASERRGATALLHMDGYALYYIGLLSVLTLILLPVSRWYLERSEQRRADYYALVLLAGLGAAVLAASSHFVSLFLGLEILSVSLYGLVGYPSSRAVAIEAGLKYLVLAGATSALLLLGVAFVYSVTGSLVLSEVASASQALSGTARAVYVAGLVLFLAGIGFKLALVPFHMWTPDVYQGSIAPVTALIASVSKVAVFAVLLRCSAALGLDTDGASVVIISVIAYASMLGGNLLALLQSNVKRMLAYSSIGHLGFLLVGLLAGGSYAGGAVSFYVSTYALAIVAAFGVLAMATSRGAEPEYLDSLRGLGRARPWLAGVLAVALLSLAGLPVSAGFIGKFALAQAGAQSGRWGLVVVLVLSSVLGLFYYLRVVVTLFSRRPEGGVAGFEARRGARLAESTLALVAAVLVVLGVYPSLLYRLIGDAAGIFG